MLRLLVLLLIALTSVPSFSAANDTPLTNADVIRMIKAELDESTIVLAIKNRPSQFDISPDGLIAMKSGGATKAVLDAMIAPKSSGSPSSQPSPSNWQARVDTNTVYLIDGDSRIALKDTQTRTAYSNTFTQNRMLQIFSGPHAETQVATNLPVFEFYAMSRFRAGDLVQIVKPTLTSDGREVVVSASMTRLFGATLGSTETNSKVPTDIEEVKDAALNLGGMQMLKYRVKPTSPLAPGEYVFMLSLIHRSYDFGVKSSGTETMGSNPPAQ